MRLSVGVLCNLNPTELEECHDGSLGYTIKGKFYKMYGPPKTEREVPVVTMSYEEGIERGFEKWGIGIHLSNCRAHSFQLDNVLLFCDSWEDPDGPMFVPQPWPRNGDNINMRAVYPAALRGLGAMVQSNQNMVYVIAASLPNTARPGYLAVDGTQMVRK